MGWENSSVAGYQTCLRLALIETQFYLPCVSSSQWMSSPVTPSSFRRSARGIMLVIRSAFQLKRDVAVWGSNCIWEASAAAKLGLPL